MASFKTAKQIGDLMGLSVKALRLYETHGLISPGRTPAGWRSYSDTEIKQLYKIKALKSMGFKLADIAGLLAGDIEVAEILAVQAETLAEQSDGIKRSLTIVRHAHARVQDGEMLSTDDLIHLTQEINKMSEFEWTEAHEKLAKRTPLAIPAFTIPFAASEHFSSAVVSQLSSCRPCPSPGPPHPGGARVPSFA